MRLTKLLLPLQSDLIKAYRTVPKLMTLQSAVLTFLDSLSLFSIALSSAQILINYTLSKYRSYVLVMWYILTSQLRYNLNNTFHAEALCNCSVHLFIYFL